MLLSELRGLGRSCAKSKPNYTTSTLTCLHTVWEIAVQLSGCTRLSRKEKDCADPAPEAAMLLFQKPVGLALKDYPHILLLRKV